MSRVTPAEVKTIVTTNLDDSTIQIWIDAASRLIDNKTACIGGDTEALAQVELYLSAHYVFLLDKQNTGQIKRTKIDVFETEFSEKVLDKELINHTTYGMTANMLSNGCLLSTTKAKASVDFL